MQEGGGTSSPENLVFFAPSRVPAWLAAAFATILVSARIELVAGTYDTPWPRPPFGLVWWIGALLVLLCAIPRRVEVGAEGLSVSWLSAPKLVRYDDVVRAAALSTSELLIELSNGETLRICHTLRTDAPRMVLAQLWRTIARASEDGARESEGLLLARGSRTLEAWAAALDDLGVRALDYRSELSHDRLWELVRHPAVDGEVRGAAAFIVARSLDDEARGELRQLAKGSVVEPLRHVFGELSASTSPRDRVRALERLTEGDPYGLPDSVP